MRAAMRITGTQKLLAELRNTGLLVPENARKAMTRAAERIVREAQLNAPVDLHNLEKSIHLTKSYSTFRGRLQIDIEVGGFVDGVNVDLYAMEIHENYDAKRAGPGTRAKQAANPGRYVGGKFLERALASETPKLRPSLIEAIVRAVRGQRD